MKYFVLPVLISAFTLHTAMATEVPVPNIVTPNANAAVNTPSTSPATPNATVPRTTITNNTAKGWLGVGLATVPKVLATQLSHLIPAGQGILIAYVQAGSPAAKAGLEINDVLLTIDNQKLYSVEQLSALVAHQANKNVNVQLVHQGQLKNVNIKIAVRTKNKKLNVSQNSVVWDSFESVQVNTLADERYHAEVRYKNQNNEKKQFVFEGKKDEIVTQINKQAGFPVEKRQALLNALNMQSNPSFNDFFKHPSFYTPFSHPLFSIPFFNTKQTNIQPQHTSINTNAKINDHLVGL